MDSQQLSDQLHELQVSLKDGDDLVKAIGLIGDALERRMDGIRRCLEDLHEDTDVQERERLLDIVDRVGRTLDTYEDKLEERRRRMEELIDEFQASLGEEAAALSEFQARLGSVGQHSTDGQSGDGSGHLPGGSGADG